MLRIAILACAATFAAHTDSDAGAISAPASVAPAVSGLVDGYVWEITGTRIAPSVGATVTLTRTNGVKVRATTGSGGYFSMFVPDGDYTTAAVRGTKHGTSWGVHIGPPFAYRSRVNFNIQ